jgi:hypothetical protein
VTEATKKALEDLQAEHRVGVQRIEEWAGEASTTLVPLGISPIPVSELSASISNALSVLDSAAERLRRLDQILSARLEAEGSRLYRAVVDYVLTCRCSMVWWPPQKTPPRRASKTPWRRWPRASRLPARPCRCRVARTCKDKARVPLEGECNNLWFCKILFENY